LANNFAHAHLPTLGPIRAALTYQDLYFDTKFGPSQSRDTLSSVLFKLGHSGQAQRELTPMKAAWHQQL